MKGELEKQRSTHMYGGDDAMWNMYVEQQLKKIVGPKQTTASLLPLLTKVCQLSVHKLLRIMERHSSQQ